MQKCTNYDGLQYCLITTELNPTHWPFKWLAVARTEVFTAASSVLHVKTPTAVRESTFSTLDAEAAGSVPGKCCRAPGQLKLAVPFGGRRVQNVAADKWARWQMRLLFFFSFWNYGKSGRRAFPPGRREPRLPDAVDCLPVLYSPSLPRRDNLLQMTPCC